MRTGSSGSGLVPVAGSQQHGNEVWVSLESKKLLLSFGFGIYEAVSCNRQKAG